MDQADRRLRARIAANTRAANEDGRQMTRAARAAFLNGFEAQVDPDGSLPPEERHRRARAALRAHMSRLAARSARARRRFS